MIDFGIKEFYTLEDYIALVAFLRSERGCPWDRKQTHESLRKNLLEESYECCEAIDEGDAMHLREELGDVLLQVLLHADIAKGAGHFTLDDIADAACKKLVSRHTHVFGDTVASSESDALSSWEAAKKAERSQTTVSATMDSVPRALPGLMRSQKIQDKAAKVGFDWPIVDGALEKLREEVDELSEGMQNNDLPNIEEEIGDILFSAVNVARFFDIDSEQAMHKSCEKFTRRFEYVERGAAALGKSLDEMSLDEMEHIYQAARRDLEGKEIASAFPKES